jgi:hypothetical protein
MSVRTPSGVRKVYLGRRAAGHEAAAAVERRRQDRLTAIKTIQSDTAATAEADQLAAELREWTEALSSAWLVLAGYHRHHGCWRMKAHG